MKAISFDDIENLQKRVTELEKELQAANERADSLICARDQMGLELGLALTRAEEAEVKLNNQKTFSEQFYRNAEKAELDARVLANAIRNWSVGDDETMNEVDDALLVALQEHGEKYLNNK